MLMSIILGPRHPPPSLTQSESQPSLGPLGGEGRVRLVGSGSTKHLLCRQVLTRWNVAWLALEAGLVCPVSVASADRTRVPVGGYAIVPEGPSLGLELDEE